MYRHLAGLALLSLLVPGVLQAADRVRGSQRLRGEEAPAFRQGNNRFALALYQQLRGHSAGNLFFSPFSLSTALAMTSAGARGETLAQMERALHLPPQKILHAEAGPLLARLDKPHRRKFQLRVASTLWGQKGQSFKKEFATLLGKHYPAGWREVDFRQRPEKVRQTINAWVEERTERRIRNFVRAGMVDSSTSLLLTSAIHFRGDWAHPFVKEHTGEGVFHLTPSRTITAPMMYREGTFAHGILGGANLLELPYADEELSMVLLVPRKLDGLADLEKGLTAERLDAALRAMRPARVELLLPRFHLTVEVQLREVLSQMGMPLAFTHAADFSGMDPGRTVFLGAAMHKAAVAVGERGTEASAATAIAVKAKSVGPGLVVRADRPFLFLIQDRRSGCILFLGRVMQPRSETPRRR